jgi:UDP-2,3-diacylglucosamine pyrophosphatase LpxH
MLLSPHPYTRAVNETELKKMIRDYAALVFKNKKFDYLVTGHVHVQDEFKFENSGNEFQSVNLGSWFQQAKALHLTEQGHDWKNLT